MFLVLDFLYSIYSKLLIARDVWSMLLMSLPFYALTNKQDVILVL